MSSLTLRHIASAESNSTLVPHWGYVDRILPCTNDAGSCEYLTAVYWMHDVSMLYTFILWAIIGFVLLTFLTLRILKPKGHNKQGSEGASESQKNSGSSSTFYRAWRGTQAGLRRRLLPESLTDFFGNVTSLQLVVLAILLCYLLIFSLVAIVYKIWITPVKKTTLHNTRSGLGGFSDRVGALAYALTPLTILLSSRESLLTLITGLPYPAFNFLHRWLGRIVFIQSFIHTLGWTLIEGRFYQPQPTTYRAFIKETYIVWGVVAMTLITFLYIFSLRRVINLTGYEFFREAHYIVAGIYLGACWAHWNHLACWMIASLGIFGLDRGIRLLRTILIHTGYINGQGFGFHPFQSSIQHLCDPDGGVIRLELTPPPTQNGIKNKLTTWSPGQHFFLAFPDLSIWQSHPFTIASISNSTDQKQVYIIRCREGETAKLKSLAHFTSSTPVVITGAYGTPLLPSNQAPSNILAIAGGTGVSLTLPVLLAYCQSRPQSYAKPAIDFIWMIRRESALRWISTELSELKSHASNSNLNLRIHIYITRESSSAKDSKSSSLLDSEIEKVSSKTDTKPTSLLKSSSVSSKEDSSPNFTVTFLQAQRPDLGEMVNMFMEERANGEFTTRVIASGPIGMGSDLRRVVAAANDGGRVWKGERRWDVCLEWDDRMG